MTTRVYHCPSCNAAVMRPAREGGVVLLSKHARLEESGAIVLKCPQPGCGADLEVCKGTVLRLRLRVPLTPSTVGSTTDPATTK